MLIPRFRKRAVAYAGSAGKPYPALVDIARALQASSPVDHLIFGDSVLERVSKRDDDRRPLGAMVADRVVPAPVVVISRQGHHPALYEWLLRAASIQPGKPRRSIVLPVNMRCFSPQWDLNPNWQFEQEIRLLSRYLEQPGDPIPAIEDVLENPRAMKGYWGTPVAYPLSRYRTIGEFARVIAVKPEDEGGILARWRDIFIFHYGHPLSSEHRRLNALVSAATIASSLAPRVLVYVTPLDTGAMERIVGSELVDQVRANVEVVRRALQGHVVDWSEAATEEDFFSPNHPTAHLNAAGRVKLSELIAGQLA